MSPGRFWGSGGQSGMDSIWESINKVHDDQLDVEKVDLCLTRNRKAHHTDEYELEKLIVRRGQSFIFDVELDRSFQADTDSIQVFLMYGQKPRISKGTLIKLTPEKAISDNKDWAMKIDSASRGNRLRIEMMPSVASMVGEYKMAIDCLTNGKMSRFQVKEPIIVLFNAWCPEDPVYMADPAERNEYVLEDTGKVYVGSIRNVIGRPWIFGQFDDTVLLSALFLLDSGNWVPDEQKGDVVVVSRAFTALANSSDRDNGILCGNWTGDYTGGVSPTSWTGSVDVIEKYWKNRPKAVKFGQCWVFSGVLCSLYRTLGIPARSVTNFCSGHDSDKSNTIDIHFDHNGNSLSEYDDSSWNFHVWVEGWFKRKDLNTSEYDGWQALDATPQEASSGRMQCGPAPIAAIKKGDMKSGHDTGFVFAEVNGDQIYWIVDKAGGMRISRVDAAAIGRLIATKAVGSDRMVDVKGHYKFSEGSSRERDAVADAACTGARAKYLEEYYKKYQIAEDMKFELTNTDIKMGQSFVINLEAKNTSRETRYVKVTMTGVGITYMGKPLNRIKRTEDTLVVQGNREARCSLCIAPEDYVGLIKPDGALKVEVVAKVEGTGQIFTTQEQFDFNKPKIVLTPSKSTVRKGETIKLNIQLENPLAVSLKNASVRLEAARNLRPVNINCGVVKPRYEISATVSVPTRRVGQKKFVATFDSDELKDIQGECTVNIIGTQNWW